MEAQSAEAVTQLLVKWANGDTTALDRLMPLVYEELKRVARAYIRRERNNLTLEPTALVHEAYVRLVAEQSMSRRNRAQFFGVAARLMRHILVDHARRRGAAKRGANQVRISFSKAERIGVGPDVSLIALDDALNDFADSYPEHSRVVELRFFGGLTIEETAEALGSSQATVEREWKFARAWLRRELSR